MARFFIAQKRAARVRRQPAAEFDFASSIAALGGDYDLVAEPPPEVRRSTPIFLIDVDPLDVEAKRAELGQDVWVEPEILHTPQSAVVGAGPDDTRPVTIRVYSGAMPIPHAMVSLIYDEVDGGGGGTAAPAQYTTQRATSTPLGRQTDGSGAASFDVPESAILRRVVVSPLTGYWEMYLDSPADDQSIDCPPLTFTPDGHDWWHAAVNATGRDAAVGAGIRIGVLDTGVGPHPALAHVRSVGSWLDSKHDPDAAGDVDVHGTHACGIIGARPDPGRGYWGIAPGAEILAGRVFGRPGGRGATQGDIVLGILALAQTHQADLINLSLGARDTSGILSDAIDDARDAGCLCICAAGNIGREVLSPANAASAVAVGALGQAAGYPPGSWSGGCIKPNVKYAAGNGLALANFSCRGKEITCCAPGVGIVSCVPEIDGASGAFWAAMAGTSMATPIVTGLLADLLARDPKYLRLPRDAKRRDVALAKLLNACVRNNLADHMQGRGMPVI